MTILKGQLELLRTRRDLLQADVHRGQWHGPVQVDGDRRPRGLDFHVELAVRLGAQAHHRFRHLVVDTRQGHGCLDGKSVALIAIDRGIAAQLGVQSSDFLDLVRTNGEDPPALPVHVDAGLVDFRRGQSDLGAGKFQILVESPRRQRIAISTFPVSDQQVLPVVVVGSEDIQPIVAIRIDDSDVHQELSRLERYRILHEGSPRTPEPIGIGPGKLSRGNNRHSRNCHDNGNPCHLFPCQTMLLPDVIIDCSSRLTCTNEKLGDRG